MIRMNRWRCGMRDCVFAVFGLGDVVGLRALGWEVSFRPGGDAILRCPIHYGDLHDVADHKRLPAAARAAARNQAKLFTPIDREARRGRAPTFSPWQPEL